MWITFYCLWYVFPSVPDSYTALLLTGNVSVCDRLSDALPTISTVIHEKTTFYTSTVRNTAVPQYLFRKLCRLFLEYATVLKRLQYKQSSKLFPQREWQMSLRNIWASDDRRKICCWAPAESLTLAGGIPIISAAVSWRLKHRANAFSGLAYWLNKRRTSNVYSKTTFTQSLSLSALFNFQRHLKSDVKYSECL